MSNDIKDLRKNLAPEQRKIVKGLFFVMVALAILSCWLMYSLWQDSNPFLLVFVFSYFYTCNVATNARELLAWPFYFGE